jgi:hypothetical protein
MSHAQDSLTQWSSAVQQLLPKNLWGLPLARLPLNEDLTNRLTEQGLLTLGEVLLIPAQELANGSIISGEDQQALQSCLASVLADGLMQFDASQTATWSTMKAQLFGPLEELSRSLLKAAVGIDAHPKTRSELMEMAGDTRLDEHLQSIRTKLVRSNTTLVPLMQQELDREFAAFDGILYAGHSARGSIVDIITDATGDAALGLRLLAFCLPDRCHFHRGVLHGVSPRRFRDLLRRLPQIVPQHRLPLAVDLIIEHLADRDVVVPRGVLLHVLRSELRTAIELDGEHGEIAVPDPRSPGARLIDILKEIGEPTDICDLIFAYRERFRFASKQRLQHHLTTNSCFLRIAKETWSLRQWHEAELDDCREIAEQIARQITAAEQRLDIFELVTIDHDERTAWLVLDNLSTDPRIRMLGRGQACSAERTQSSVMQHLNSVFKKAAGDVVTALFIENQPATQRRLIHRLLNHNRAFVHSGPNRIDTITNYPFNTQRINDLTTMVRENLQKRAGYAHIDAILETVNNANLGGDWLTTDLLADILRRNGPFEQITSKIVALESMSLPTVLRKSARQALRALGEAVTIDDLAHVRADLVEFVECLPELLLSDPLVQSPDGKYFILA